MPFIRKDEFTTTPIYLAGVDQFNTAEDAAKCLWQSVYDKVKIYGGAAILKVPDDGEWGFTVTWEHGPEQWADAYVVAEDAQAPGFSVEAENGKTVRFLDF